MHRQKTSVGKLIQKSKRGKRKEVIHNISMVGRGREKDQRREIQGIGRKMGRKIDGKICGHLEEGVSGVVREGVDYESDEGMEGQRKASMEGVAK